MIKTADHLWMDGILARVATLGANTLTRAIHFTKNIVLHKTTLYLDLVLGGLGHFFDKNIVKKVQKNILLDTFYNSKTFWRKGLFLPGLIVTGKQDQGKE